MTEKKIKIGDLSILSNVNKSTIHHYLRLGILHPPQKNGRRRSFYDSSHLRILKRIRYLRENDKLPLAKIKQVLSKEKFHPLKLDPKKDNTALLIHDLEVKKKHTKTQKDEIKRFQIVDAAIALFIKNGYERTTLESIADSIHMAKSTVYLYFENKNQLFLKCIDRLTFVAVPEETWKDIRNEKNCMKRLQKRANAFHKAFHNYKGILTIIKTAIVDENSEIAEKAKTALTLMTKHIKKDIRQGIAQGVFKDVNEDIIAHLILSMGEGIGYRLMLDSQYTIEEAIEIMFELVGTGILRDSASEISQTGIPFFSGEVTDIKGNKINVSKMSFGKNGWLAVKIGKAQVKIFLHKIKEMIFVKKKSSFQAQIKTTNGQSEWAEVDDSIFLSGVVHFGEFTIELKNVESIRFKED